MINTSKNYFKFYIVAIAAMFALISSASAMVSLEGPSHGWNGQSIRLDYGAGGPNIKVLEQTGITVTRLYSENYNAFGYFTYDPFTNNLIESHEISFADNDSAFIGYFAADTNIGTWLSTDEGTFYSMPSMNKRHEYRAAYLGDTMEGDMVIGLEGDHRWSGTDYREMIVAIEPDTHAPAGQPLPGLLISTLLGAGVAGVVRMKKLRK
jgi:hypothetical protein